jgi:hypothetical protein
MKFNKLYRCLLDRTESCSPTELSNEIMLVNSSSKSSMIFFLVVEHLEVAQLIH